jgi:2,4-dienoyl-CoA reductase-like NADH-dependent reductase (Old Yellow Enzyme family)
VSILFTPINIGATRIPNRFVHSATFEAMASEIGEVSDTLVKRYQNLSRGEIGLIIPGYMYVHPLGRAMKSGLGIHSDNMVPGLRKLVDTVHGHGGKIAFQLFHAGRQTTKAVIGQTPIGPSSVGRDPANFVKPREMREDDIQEAIEAFGSAASRAAEAGADGIQIHAAHGYLINEFLSPFFNHRDDGWGGSEANRFRFLREVFLNVRKKTSPQMPLLVKLNTNDYTPREGVTPSLAATYAKWLVELGIDGLELSCGTSLFSTFNMVRGEVPVKQMISGLAFWKRPLAKLGLGRMVGKYDLLEGYNLEAAKMIKPVIGKTPLLLVGGFRRVAHMEETLEKGYADCISMCRPFIREPLLVQRIKEGKAESASCISCNRCFAAVANNMPVRCYVKGFSSD